MAYTIFSIDNVSDVHTLAKFMRHVDTLEAISRTKGRTKTCIGSYKGVLEYSFIMLTTDFNEHIIPMGWVDNQESVLHIYPEKSGRFSTFIRENPIGTDNLSEHYLGVMQEVSKKEALVLDGWTYRPDLDVYYGVM